MNVLRVFVRRTSYTPDDPLAFVGAPPLPALIGHDMEAEEQRNRGSGKKSTTFWGCFMKGEK